MKSIQFLGKRALWLLGWFFLTSLAMASESVTYYHNDVAGTPVLATDASGAVVWKETYLPYGKKQTNAAASADNRIGFTGKPYDSATGLSYFGARYYDPLVGRFNGIDPNGFEEGNLHSFNRYAYANNNPYKFVDPDGRVAETVWDVVNVAMDVASLAGNLAVGNYSAAAVDGLGLVIDGLATAVPFVPGGAGMAIKAARGVDAAKGSEKVVYRLGADKESASRLARKSAEAEAAGFPHGVSVSTTKPPPGTPCSSASCSALEARGLKVHHTKTGRDSNHHTVELPKPVTREAADAFNQAFGR